MMTSQVDWGARLKREIRRQKIQGFRDRLVLTSRLWEEGTSSSIFLPVKMSVAVKWHLAWPCLPVLEVVTSMTCARGRVDIIISSGTAISRPLAGREEKTLTAQSTGTFDGTTCASTSRVADCNAKWFAADDSSMLRLGFVPASLVRTRTGLVSGVEEKRDFFAPWSGGP